MKWDPYRMPLINDDRLLMAQPIREKQEFYSKAKISADRVVKVHFGTGMRLQAQQKSTNKKALSIKQI